MEEEAPLAPTGNVNLPPIVTAVRKADPLREAFARRSGAPTPPGAAAIPRCGAVRCCTFSNHSLSLFSLRRSNSAPHAFVVDQFKL